MERKEAIEVIKKNWPDSSFTMLREALESLIPELAESEDEKIRKEIMELVMQPTWKTEKEFHRRKELCTWLEKQCEQKDILEDAILDNNEDGLIAETIRAKQAEQKPIGFNIGDEITVNGQICRVVAVDNPAWSEEDESTRKAMSNLIGMYFCGCTDISGRDRLHNWLNSLKDRVQPRPKQEWSEEDEVKINRIVACLENLNVADNDILLKDVDWLKSLKDRVQPKEKWSEEDEEALEVAIIALEDMYSEDSPLDCYAGHHIPFDKAANQLKSLRPQSQWKPSEQDILLLERIFDGKSDPKDFQASLQGIIEQLKKLMEE